jgi:hypothetical protein
VGRTGAPNRAGVAAQPRLDPQANARFRGSRHDERRVRARDRRRPDRRRQVRGARRRGDDEHCSTATGEPVRRACALAGIAVRRRPLRIGRAVRDRPPRGAAHLGARGADRRTARAGRTPCGGSRPDGSRLAVPAPRAAATHAHPLTASQRTADRRRCRLRRLASTARCGRLRPRERPVADARRARGAGSRHRRVPARGRLIP